VDVQAVGRKAPQQLAELVAIAVQASSCSPALHSALPRSARSLSVTIRSLASVDPPVDQAAAERAHARLPVDLREAELAVPHAVALEAPRGFLRRRQLVAHLDAVFAERIEEQRVR
jgi:hypothetical protein